MAIHFSPSYNDDQTIFTGSIGLLLKSIDRGSSWQQIPLKYPSLKKKILYKLSAWGLPKKIARKYLNIRETHPVYPTVAVPTPDYKDSNTVLFGTRWHGVYKSNAGGLEYEQTWENEDGYITELSPSPNFNKDGVAFMFIRGDGVYKTNDKGDSWDRINNGGLPFAAERSHDLGEVVKDSDFYILFSPNYVNDNTIFGAGSPGLYISKDSGENWHKTASKLLGNTPNIIAIGISPNYSKDTTMLVSIKGLGLYKSTDNGQSFFETGENLIESNNSIEHIAFSPDFSTDETVYIASDQHIYRSRDKGKSWRKLQRQVRYENHRGVVKYKGQWARKNSPEASASSVHYSTTAGDQASLAFNGCQVRWIATQSPKGGKASIYIDNKLASTIDLYSEKIMPMSIVFNDPSLNCGAHEITIKVIGSEGNSSRHQVNLDAFEIM